VRLQRYAKNQSTTAISDIKRILQPGSWLQQQGEKDCRFPWQLTTTPSVYHLTAHTTWVNQLSSAEVIQHPIGCLHSHHMNIHRHFFCKVICGWFMQLGLTALFACIICVEQPTTQSTISRADITVRGNHLTTTGNHMPYRITQCYLPPSSGDFPAFTPSRSW